MMLLLAALSTGRQFRSELRKFFRIMLQCYKLHVIIDCGTGICCVSFGCSAALHHRADDAQNRKELFAHSLLAVFLCVPLASCITLATWSARATGLLAAAIACLQLYMNCSFWRVLFISMYV